MGGAAPLLYAGVGLAVGLLVGHLSAVPTVAVPPPPSQPRDEGCGGGSNGGGSSSGLSMSERRPAYDTEEYHDHVAGLLAHVEPQYKDPCRALLMGEGVTFGQGYQDWHMIHNAGYNYRAWGNGWYLDIGTNGPARLSNTLALDKCLGWKGVCVEAQPKFHDAIREKRSCELYPHCLLGTARTVKATGDHAIFSVVRATPHDAPGTVMQCKGVRDMLADIKVAPPGNRFDFASIDIEGAEPHVLRCWPFEAVPVTHWLVETNKQPQVAVDWFFNAHGYNLVATFADWMRGGYFIDSLYERRARPYKRPSGPGVVVSEFGNATRLRRVVGRNPFLTWPKDGRPVRRSAPGEGKSLHWLECNDP